MNLWQPQFTAREELELDGIGFCMTKPGGVYDIDAAPAPEEADPPLGVRRDAVIRERQLEVDVDSGHEVQQRVGELKRENPNAGLGLG